MSEHALLLQDGIARARSWPSFTRDADFCCVRGLTRALGPQHLSVVIRSALRKALVEDQLELLVATALGQTLPSLAQTCWSF